MDLLTHDFCYYTRHIFLTPDNSLSYVLLHYIVFYTGSLCGLTSFVSELLCFLLCGVKEPFFISIYTGAINIYIYLYIYLTSHLSFPQHFLQRLSI
jgi:hypothetical protein